MTSSLKTDTIALKKIMIEKGYDKIVDLSRKSGIDRTTLGRVLKGKSQPTTDVMYKLVDTLEIPPETAGIIFFSPNLRNT